MPHIDIVPLLIVLAALGLIAFLLFRHEPCPETETDRLPNWRVLVGNDD